MSKLKSWIVFIIGIALMALSMPGLINSIRSFSDTPNFIILFFNVVILIGGLIPFAFGISLMANAKNH